MPIPQPRFRSAAITYLVNGVMTEFEPAGRAQDGARETAIAEARLAPPFIDCPDATGKALAEMDSMCRHAGLNCDWLTLKARARTVGKAIPAHVPLAPNSWDPTWVEQFNFDTRGAEKLRAWAYEFAIDLISDTIEQHDEALTVWKWW